MGKTTAPLLSFGASGQIAQTLVYSKWKGRGYARRYVIPSNPQTAEQSLTRNTFRWLSDVWKQAPADFTLAFNAYAQGKVMTGRNALVKFELPNLREETDLANFVFSPGALGGLPPASITVTPGADQLTVACTAPAVLPSGWTIARAIFGIIPDQDPQTDIDYIITTMEDASSAYSVVFTGLDEILYRAGAWFEWTRPDGKLAYSPSLQGADTPT